MTCMYQYSTKERGCERWFVRVRACVRACVRVCVCVCVCGQLSYYPGVYSLLESQHMCTILSKC